MPDYREVYEHHADRYDTLVSHEDHEGNLGRALFELMGERSLDVVETGAGTGRLTRLIAPRARTVKAFDAAAPMIDVAKQSLPSVEWGVALHDALPVPDASADFALEGWAFGHALAWNPTGWRDDLQRWVRELERIVRPGGTLVMIETMGTGVATPFEGGHSLEPFHAFALETLGFSHRVLRTDYAFATVDDAAQTLGFFFGERLITRVRENGWTVVPECTGLYWRQRAGRQ
ncbi:MAG: class I SAM-dependent methyltransferase [Archangium sp.]|nr:class I SAM-dependent methyltransferase [Archangium sp.]